MDVEAKAALILESLPALQPGEAHRAIAAALTAAHNDGANTYAHAALVALTRAGVSTPERGYVADGGPEQLAADMRVGFERAREEGRRAGLEEARKLAMDHALRGEAAWIEARKAVPLDPGRLREVSAAMDTAGYIAAEIARVRDA